MAQSYLQAIWQLMHYVAGRHFEANTINGSSNQLLQVASCSGACKLAWRWWIIRKVRVVQKEAERVDLTAVGQPKSYLFFSKHPYPFPCTSTTKIGIIGHMTTKLVVYKQP